MDGFLSCLSLSEGTARPRRAQAQSGIAKQPPQAAMPPGIVLDGAEHGAKMGKAERSKTSQVRVLALQALL